MKNKKKKNAAEKEPNDHKTQDGVGREGKVNTGTVNENNDEGDNDETERAGQDERDEKVDEVEAEVRRETDGIKSANRKPEEAEDEIETLSDVKNGEMEGEEGKSGEEAYHLHNGLDEKELLTNEAQDENGIDAASIDSANTK